MNPADLTLSSLDAAGPLSAKSMNSLGIISGKSSKLSFSAPRIDTEPIYTQLKSQIGDSWSDYKNALSCFLLGKLNQTELTLVLTPILSTPVLPPAPSPVHLHNTLLSALHFNAAYRDPPPDTTAPFVLATDTLSASASAPKTTGASDAVSDRLKREVMALSARDRRRLKSLNDTSTPKDTGARQARTYREALDALPSSVVYGLGGTTAPSSGAGGAGASAAAGGGAKTNTDLEIRRRFALPLAGETQEFPAKEHIRARIEPIAYEEGLGGAMLPAQLSAAGDLVEAAVETYVKELVGAWLASARGDADGLVQGRRYRKRVRAEERAEERGEVARDPLGRLPVEVEYTEKREALGRADLRLAWRLEGGCRDDRFLGERWAEEEMEGVEMGVGKMGLLAAANGINGTSKHEETEDGANDDADWGWAGAAPGDRAQLMDVLGGALAVGS